MKRNDIIYLTLFLNGFYRGLHFVCIVNEIFMIGFFNTFYSLYEMKSPRILYSPAKYQYIRIF
jgi:hypothetical protein